MEQIKKHYGLYRQILEYKREGNFLNFDEFIKELEKALTDEWISTDDDLPECLLGVLVYVENEDHMTAGYREPDESWTLTDDGRQVEAKYITHWRMLPQRPVEKND